MTAAVIQQTQNNAPETAAISVSLGALQDKLDWDAYVKRHSGGSFFHLFGWGEVIQAAYGYQPLYIIARQGDEIVGVLMLIDVKSPMLGRSINATAFTVGGGPLGESTEVLEMLAQYSISVGEQRRVKYIELRTEEPVFENWETKTGKYAVFRSALSADESDNLKRIPRKRRAEVRKAIAAEEAGSLGMRYENDADGFYALYARSVRDLGTPVFPRKFLLEILRVFSKESEISFVEHEGVAVASLVSFYFKGSVMPYYVGASPQARAVRAHDFLYWSLMRRAVMRQCTTFDFGRSKVDSGPYHFKKLWGIEPTPLTYQFKLIGAKEMPDINPKNPKFERFTQIWKHLPLTVANRLGPLLAPNFP